MLKLTSGDIIENAKKYEVEAIVNPNNKYIDYGCGVLINKEQFELLLKSKEKINRKD